MTASHPAVRRCTRRRIVGPDERAGAARGGGRGRHRSRCRAGVARRRATRNAACHASTRHDRRTPHRGGRPHRRPRRRHPAPPDRRPPAAAALDAPVARVRPTGASGASAPTPSARSSASRRTGSTSANLRKLSRVEARTSAVDAERTLVRLVADRSPQRTEALAGGAAVGGFSLVATGVLVVVATPVVAAATPVALGAGYATARMGRSRHDGLLVRPRGSARRGRTWHPTGDAHRRRAPRPAPTPCLTAPAPDGRSRALPTSVATTSRQATGSRRAGTCLCHGVPAIGSRSAAVGELVRRHARAHQSGDGRPSRPSTRGDLVEPEAVRQRDVSRLHRRRRPRPRPPRSPRACDARAPARRLDTERRRRRPARPAARPRRPASATTRSRMIVLAVNERRSPADSTNGNSARRRWVRRRAQLRARRAAPGSTRLDPSVGRLHPAATPRPSRRAENVTPEWPARIASNSASPSSRPSPVNPAAAHRRLGIRARSGGPHPTASAADAAPSGSVGPSVRYSTTGASAPSAGSAAVAAKNAVGERGSTALGGGTQRRQLARRSNAPSASHSRAWISGSGSVPAGAAQQRLAQVEHVVRELEVEERRLPLLELGRRRQHVVRPAGRSRSSRRRSRPRARARRSASRMRAAVGQRVRRVAALDDHRPVAVGVVGEDLVGHHVARHEAADDPGAGDRADACSGAPPLGPAARRGSRATVGMYCAPGLGEVAGEQPQQLLQVAAQRACGGSSGCRGPRRRRRSPAPAIRRAAARTSSSSTPQRCRVAPATSTRREAGGDLVEPGGVLGEPGRVARGPPAPARRPARPGTRRRCRAGPAGGSRPASAVSVRRGSMTIIARSGSLAISLSTVRARGKPWDCHGFLPTKTATSACSKSPRMWPPNILPFTQNSPVFSWASAFDR